MCGRFTLTIHQFEAVVEALGATVVGAGPEAYRPRYNIAPGSEHWMLLSEERRRALVPARWGLVPPWAKSPDVGYKLINARAETLAERPAFRSAYAARRCVVPADGFYEWHGDKGNRRPIWFHHADRTLLRMAGLYERWQPADGGAPLVTFTIVTTEAAPPVAAVHTRMPALLEPKSVDAWLHGDHPDELLRPTSPGTLAARPASRRVNSPKNDDPRCLDPDDDEVAAAAQLSLL